MKGCVQVYTGNGKGKTTAALGLALRASGCEKKIFIGQFMKGQKYSELNALAKIPCIDVEQFGLDKCIRKEEVTPEYVEKTKKALEYCKEKILSRKYDIVILDEINVSVWFGLAEEKDVLDIIDEKPAEVELVLTGRYASEAIIDKADLVTEMKCIKHYFDKGIPSREGIEC